MSAPFPSRPWYREPWPWILMAGPAAVVVAGIVTTGLALIHDDPLVVDNYYKEGLAINRVIERDHAAQQAGYRAQVVFSEDGARVRVYLATNPSPTLDPPLKGRELNPIPTPALPLKGRESARPGSLRLRMVHPTQAALDREAVLRSTQPGWYEGEVGLAAAARWRVELEDDLRGWRLTGEWRPAEGGALALEPRT